MSPQRRIKEQRNRLSAARLALLGEKTSREIDDFDALFVMAFGYSQDRQTIWWSRLQKKLQNTARRDSRPRSIRELANEAADFSVGIGSKASTEDRLRSKFTQHKEDLLDFVRHSNDVRSTIDDQVLKKIAALLQPYLAVNLDVRVERLEKKKRAHLASSSKVASTAKNAAG